MATAYKADNYTNPSPDSPEAGAILCREFLWTFAAAIVINDTVKLCPIPGASVVVVDQWFLDVPDIDDSTGSTIQLGDNTTADKFLAQNTTGRSAGRLNGFTNGVAASIPVKYTANNDLVLKFDTAPTTSATSGVFRGAMFYHHVGVATPV